MNLPMHSDRSEIGSAGQASSESSSAAKAALRLAVNDMRTRGYNTLGIKCLIALVLLAFGIAHVIGAIILSRSAASDQRPRAIEAVHSD